MKKRTKVLIGAVIFILAAGLAVTFPARYRSLSIGFRSMGRILDPVLKVYFSEEFEKELEEHARIEFKKLSEMLS